MESRWHGLKLQEVRTGMELMGQDGVLVLHSADLEIKPREARVSLIKYSWHITGMLVNFGGVLGSCWSIARRFRPLEAWAFLTAHIQP